MSEKRRQHEIKLILLLAAISLLVYLAAAVLLLTGDGADEDQDAAVCMTSSVNTMKISGEEGSFSMVKDKTDWVCVEEEVPLNSTDVSAMASGFAELTADRVIEDGSRYFSQFGLDDPAYRVSAGSNGEEKTWNVGNYNDILGQYYVTVDEEDTIYLVPKRQMEKCMKTLRNLVATPGVTSMKSTEIEMYEVETRTESYQTWKEGENYRYKTADGTVYTGDSYTAENIFFALKNIACDNCITYDAAESEMRSYGLENPDIVIRLDMTDGTVFQVKVAEAGDGTAYLNAWDNSIIYQITEEELENLKEKISLENQLKQ